MYTAFNLPFAIWLLRGFFREVPAEVREAAIIDGCTEFQVFRRMMLPLLTGGLVATGGVRLHCGMERIPVRTYPHSIERRHRAAVGGRLSQRIRRDWLAIGAAAVMISTPVVVFAIAMQRYLVRGLTMGSVKR